MKAKTTYIKSNRGEQFYGKSYINESGELFLWHSASYHELIKFVKKKKNGK